jgi:hypothetical protein
MDLLIRLCFQVRNRSALVTLTTSLTCGCAARALRLQARGYKALIVGGWVRDKYLGRRASDIDIATNATTWEVRCSCRKRRGVHTELQPPVRVNSNSQSVIACKQQDS